MKISTVSRARIHFTTEHAWIDFNGTVGFVGVSAFGLCGVEKIDGIRWRPPAGMVEAGTLIAEVMAGERVIPVHSPVKGRFLGKNPKLGECCSVVIESPEDKGWLFLMAPSVFGRKDEGLLKPEDYRKLIRIKN